MASEQLWGSLVKAMTRKIEVPKLGTTTVSRAPSPERLSPPPTQAPPLQKAPGTRRGSSSGGRRVTDTMLTGSHRVIQGPPAPSREVALERIAAHLSYLTRAVVEQFMNQHGGPGGVLTRRLQALGLVEEGADDAPWWTVISSGSADPEVVAEIARTAPGMPQHRSVNGLFFDFLLDAEVDSYRAVKAADQKAVTEGRRLIEVLVEGGSISEARGADLSAEFFGLRRRRGKKWSPAPDQAGTVTLELSDAFDLIPIAASEEDDALTLLVVDEPGEVVLEALKQLTGREVRLLLDTFSRFEETREAWKKAVADAQKRRQVASSGQRRGRRTGQNKGPVFRFDQDSFATISYVPEMVQAILERAADVGATDIHLEPQGNGMRVRFRLDGILHDVAKLRRNMGEDVISRIKVMADMDITERRKPQDGHIHMELQQNPFDFRIATVPTSRGERMSIRITAASKEVPTLEMLGLGPDENERLSDFTKRSHGIVLACGPVGSGKTTTLYASLGELDAQQKNIMSIEDPVEIELPDISQVNVNYKIGMDFSSGLRALLRQDPNIILVGEIRDDETAKVAVRGSLTGLLVYSSIHANSAPGAITTLYNFNIPPFLLATSLVGVIAQRLVRTICEDCREEYEPDPALLEQAGLTEAVGTEEGEETIRSSAGGGRSKKKGGRKQAEGTRFWRGRGCDACYGTGYRGRTGIFEILDINERMRHAITERASEAELRNMGVDAGMETLADRGRLRVLRGETTVEEFIRVLYQ